MSAASERHDPELEKQFAETDAAGEADVIFEERPHIPPGRYELEFQGHKGVVMRWGPKLVLNFRVAAGECAGIELSRFYNVIRFDPKGRPQVAPASAYKREMKILFPGRSLRGFAFRWLREVLVSADVVDTGSDHDRYSKIGRLVGARPK